MNIPIKYADELTNIIPVAFRAAMPTLFIMNPRVIYLNTENVVNVVAAKEQIAQKLKCAKSHGLAI